MLCPFPEFSVGSFSNMEFAVLPVKSWASDPGPGGPSSASLWFFVVCLFVFFPGSFTRHSLEPGTEGF